MKNIALNIESLAAEDGGVSRVANLILKFFSDRAKIGNDRIFLNIYRDHILQNNKFIKLNKSTLNNKSKILFIINNFVNSIRSDYILYDHLGLAKANKFLIKKRPYIVFLYGIDAWQKKPKRIEEQKNSKLSISISKFTKTKTEIIHGKLKNIKICWLSTLYNKINFHKIKNKKKFNFLFLSRLEIGKGHLDTLNSFKKINNKKANLLIVGKGPEYKNIEKKIRELNLEKNVKLLGFMNNKQLNKVWSKTDVLVMPSRVEGFGLVYIEAMSRGIPIVVSTQDAGQEINIHGKTGYSVNLDDKKNDKLFYYMNKMIHNKILTKKMGINAKKRWENNFTYSSFQKRFGKIINDFEKEIT